MSTPNQRKAFFSSSGGQCPAGYGTSPGADISGRLMSNGSSSSLSSIISSGISGLKLGNGASDGGDHGHIHSAAMALPARASLTDFSVGSPSGLQFMAPMAAASGGGGAASSAGGGHSSHEAVDHEQDGVNMLADAGGISYHNYLQLDKICNAQELQSELDNNKVHDEHLFIITHQTYELWFKQILYEIDSVRNIFIGREKDLARQAKQHLVASLDERRMLEIIKRMNRVVMILRLLVDQIHILETMTPLDFMDFRGYLSSGSGFQSLQFRLMENKLGVKNEWRVKYNQTNYSKVFGDTPNQMEKLKQSEAEESLSECVQKWLERTPGLEENGFNFPKKFKNAVDMIIKRERALIENEPNPTKKEHMSNNLKIKENQFEAIFDEKRHEAMVMRGERKFSHKALFGVIMISLYKDEPRFHQPSLFLEELMNIDALITKWRYNHVLLVQRMLGSQQLGTGGSSGYQYLRSTLSDRYKIFIDLFNASTFLIPRNDTPPLTPEMKTMLRTHSSMQIMDRK